MLKDRLRSRRYRDGLALACNRQWVLVSAIDAEFKVQVRTCSPASSTYRTDVLALAHRLAFLDVDTAQVRVHRGLVVAVFDHHHIAKAALRACHIHNACAYADEAIEIWFARGLSAGERALDAGEFLDVFSASPDELMAMCRDGRVIDCKTLVGAWWLQSLRSGAWVPPWRDNPDP